MTLADLKQLGFPTGNAVDKRRLAELLSQKYPEHEWEKVYLLRGRYAGQKWLERTVASLFPVHILPQPQTCQAILFNGVYFLLGIDNQKKCEKGR